MNLDIMDNWNNLARNSNASHIFFSTSLVQSLFIQAMKCGTLLLQIWMHGENQTTPTSVVKDRKKKLGGWPILESSRIASTGLEMKRLRRLGGFKRKTRPGLVTIWLDGNASDSGPISSGDSSDDSDDLSGSDTNSSSGEYDSSLEEESSGDDSDDSSMAIDAQSQVTFPSDDSDSSLSDTSLSDDEDEDDSSSSSSDSDDEDATVTGMDVASGHNAEEDDDDDNDDEEDDDDDDYGEDEDGNSSSDDVEERDESFGLARLTKLAMRKCLKS